MSDDLVERLARAICRANCGPRMARDHPEDVECQVANGWDMWADEARACLAELSAAGYAVVPVKPTEEMEDAGQEIIGPCYVNEQMADPGKVWSAMLAASRKEST